MNVPVALFLRETFNVVLGLIEERAVVNNFCAEIPHGCHFAGVRVLRNRDVRIRTEHASGIGDRLPVVAARSCGHTSLEFGGGHLREQIDPAAHLERAKPLMILVLNVNLVRAYHLFESDVSVERCSCYVSGYALLGLYHVM